MEKKIRFIEGLSESAWKSLIVKSLRIGWVDGLEKASTVLSKSAVATLLHSGLFEDVFPGSYQEFNEALAYIEQRDYVSLCSMDTHHGRGHTERFCDLEKDATTKGKTQGFFVATEVTMNTNLKWINPRVWNCVWTWREINPTDVGKKREPLRSPYVGMPLNVMDAHTFEGKRDKRSVTLLSGHYHNHRKIGQRVMAEGWSKIREEFLNDETVSFGKDKQISLL